MDKLKKERNKNFINVVNKFYYDGYMMNQKACNSPHFIFWVGNNNKFIQNKFWQTLNEIVDKKFNFDDVHVVEKYTNLMQNIIKIKKFTEIKRLKNNVFDIFSSKMWNNIKTKKISSNLYEYTFLKNQNLIETNNKKNNFSRLLKKN